MPNALLDTASLRPHPDGFALALIMPWYRSLWLSTFTSFRLLVDDIEVPAEDIRFELKGTQYELAELAQQSEVLWYVQEHPLLIVRRTSPIVIGDQLDVDLTGELRLPYMQISPGSKGKQGVYFPNHIQNRLRLTATDGPLAPPAEIAEAAPTQPAPAGDAPFDLGITLYSATAEFRAGWYDFAGLLARVGELGIGPGIEIVGSQSLPTYPEVSAEFERVWRDAFDRYGFVASSYGANLDMGRNRNRDMTPDEEFEFTEVQLHGAKRLGFPLIRIQSARPELLRRLLPVAEQLELKLGYEIHAPMGPNTPDVLAVRDVYEELDSPLLGFVADFSTSMRAMSPSLITAVRRAGLGDEEIERLKSIWATDASLAQRQQEFVDYLLARDFDPARLGPFARLAFNMNGHVPAEEWRDIMPQILHVHAKFYDIDDNGEEPAIDYPALVRIFAEGGYRGFWSSEWEGHAFAELGEVDPLVLVRKQHDLIRRSFAAASTATPV